MHTYTHDDLNECERFVIDARIDDALIRDRVTIIRDTKYDVKFHVCARDDYRSLNEYMSHTMHAHDYDFDDDATFDKFVDMLLEIESTNNVA